LTSLEAVSENSMTIHNWSVPSQIYRRTSNSLLDRSGPDVVGERQRNKVETGGVIPSAVFDLFSL
jgi:hypothetical protein